MQWYYWTTFQPDFKFEVAEGRLKVAINNGDEKPDDEGSGKSVDGGLRPFIATL